MQIYFLQPSLILFTLRANHFDQHCLISFVFVPPCRLPTPHTHTDHKRYSIRH